MFPMPYDMVLEIYEELHEQFSKLELEVKSFGFDETETKNYVFHKTERMMIDNGYYITEPQQFTFQQVNRTP